MGLEIIVVTAIDEDGSDDNSVLTYSLLSGNTNGWISDNNSPFSFLAIVKFVL